jgi:hypothetical protein
MGGPRRENEPPGVVPRPRNQGPADRFTVGDRNGGGELSGGPRTGGAWVNCYLGTGVTVRISAQEAEEFGLWLIECARASRGQGGPR